MAAGDTLASWGANANEPPATNFATLDTVNAHLVLDFDDTTNEEAVFSAVMPQHYAGGNLELYFHLAMTSATAGDVDIDGQFERNEAGHALGADAFAAVQSIDNTTVPGTAGNVAVIGPLVFTPVQADSIAAGDRFRVKVIRDAVSDTATGDMELLNVELREA